MKKVTIVVPKGYANLSSITGSFEILTRANAFWQKQGNRSRMEVRLAGFVPELSLSGGLFSVHPASISESDRADLIIIPSLSYDFDQVIRENARLISWMKDQYKAGAEVASICTGAFLLAATGLLEGRPCSTHWNAADDFKRLFPNVDLQIDKLVTSDKGIYTNGGAFSYLNLILFLVEKYFDRETAIYCSKIFQIEMDRTAQSPFFIFQAQKDHGDEVIIEAQAYIEQHLSDRISFEELAARLATSRRNFDRRFIKATGNKPVEYLQRVKVEVAKKALEKGRKTIYEVMDEVGYSDDKAFREVFKKITGVSPLEYRGRYNKENV